MKKSKVKKTVLTALIIAIVLVIRNFSYMVYFAGGAGMRIGVSGTVSILPALLFGPLYGGISAGIIDVLAYIIKPDGQYIPLITVTAVLGGIITGFLWKLFKGAKPQHFNKILAVVFGLTGIFGILNHIVLNFCPQTTYGGFVASFGEKTVFLTVWLEIAAALGIVFLTADSLLKNTKLYCNYFIKLAVCLLISNLLTTTANTFVLRIFIPSLGNLGFLMFYIPRVINEIITTILQAYIGGYLYKTIIKINRLD